MTHAERGAFENLLLLCYRHHVETNDPQEFPVSRLRQMKAEHEAQFAGKPFHAPDATIAAIQREAESFWISVARANTEEHVVPDLRIVIDVKATPLELFKQIRRKLGQLAALHDLLSKSLDNLNRDVTATLQKAGYSTALWESLPYYENPTGNREWEIRAIGLPNFVTMISVLIDQLELRYLEAAIAQAPADPVLRARVEALRAQVLEYADGIGHID
jgi:hypothetical protein